ncbi:MAG: hypothetical protein JNJ48_08345 [Phycisphaerae bacterium]|nr:hypothetical protein [Phycisphaerae bacterium]
MKNLCPTRRAWRCTFVSAATLAVVAGSAVWAQPAPTPVPRPQPLPKPTPTLPRPVDGIVRPPAASAGSETIVMIRPAPAGAKGKPIGKEELAKLIKRPGVRVVTEAGLAKMKANSDRTRAAVRDEFGKVAKSNADLMESMDEEAKFGPTPTLKDAKGRTIALLNSDGQMRDILVSRLKMQDAKSRADAYRAMHKAATAAARGDAALGAALAKLPGPDQVAGQGLAKINEAIAGLTRAWGDLFKPKAGSGKPHDCAKEEGAGYGGDMTDGSARSFNPNGLQARANWPLKNFTTCVRDQAARGSCVAFCLTGAAEARLAFEHNRFVNLSEQDLYKHMKLDWMWPDYCDDGYSSEWSILAQMLTGYRFPFEKDWDYNPSLNRTTDGPGCWTRSCEGYNGGPCSDTNHQAAYVCHTADVKVVKEVVEEVCEFVETIPVIGGFLGDWVCEPVTKLVETVEQVEVCVYEANIPRSTNVRITGAMPVYNTLMGTDFAVAKFWLSNGAPLSLSIGTPPSFDAATENGGFVRLPGGKEKSRGGHCVLVTGYIDNKDLPKEIAQGAGGGYLIIKNSWGTGFGDAGYAYLSYDWVRKWGRTMNAITDVSQ